MKKLKLSHVQIIALGFLILIAVGTVLLCLPFSTASGERAGLGISFFTAVSAATVTGFTLRDTVTFWSDFGHVVILLLFQVGGLGVMTIATMFFMLIRRRVGLRQREVMVESLNSTHVGGIMRLLKQLLLITAFAEAAGALLLAVRFVPVFGFGRGLWYGLFHSVSAFCNAGFDLMGTMGNCGSLSAFSDDWYVNIILMMLIILGGLGFLVLSDIYQKGFRFRMFSLQSKIVLTSSAVFIVGGAVLFWIFESNGVQAGMSGGEKLLTSLFASVTSRNAGFITTDASALSSGGRLLLMLLMFVGGSPGSASGGVKTTTIVVILSHAFCRIRRERSVSIFGRRIEDDAVNKAVAIVCINLVLIFTGSFIVCALQPEMALDRVLFEMVSALGTAGISTGLVRELTSASQWVVMVLMFLGRLGSVSFGIALLEKRMSPPVRYPIERITIG
ncbi:MAG: Trk family potassium uptake protein [Ruminococcaceae bacterium]|nr:Trk family potassium uptake protein [Oscillospiraceae bacterium]